MPPLDRPNPVPIPEPDPALRRLDCALTSLCLRRAWKWRGLSCMACQGYTAMTPDEHERDLLPLSALGQYIAAPEIRAGIRQVKRVCLT